MEFGILAAILAIFFSVLSINKRAYTVVGLVYLLLIAWSFRGLISLLCLALAIILVIQHREKKGAKTLLDIELERHPIQTSVIFAGICRGMVSRAPMVAALVEPFSPPLAAEMAQNPIGRVEEMVAGTRYPDLKRLVYAVTDNEIEHAVQATVGDMLNAKYTRAMTLSTVVGVVMLGAIILTPALLPLLRLFKLLSG